VRGDRLGEFREVLGGAAPASSAQMARTGAPRPSCADRVSLGSWAGFLMTNVAATSQTVWGQRNVVVNCIRRSRPNQSAKPVDGNVDAGETVDRLPIVADREEEPAGSALKPSDKTGHGLG
jgi:hypothetical protein